MNIAELIAELSKYPQGAPVRVCNRRVMLGSEDGEWMEYLSVEDADEADEVRGEGGFVLVWGGKP